MFLHSGKVCVCLIIICFYHCKKWILSAFFTEGSGCQSMEQIYFNYSAVMVWFVRLSKFHWGNEVWFCCILVATDKASFCTPQRHLSVHLHQHHSKLIFQWVLSASISHSLTGCPRAEHKLQTCFPCTLGVGLPDVHRTPTGHGRGIWNVHGIWMHLMQPQLCWATGKLCFTGRTYSRDQTCGHPPHLANKTQADHFHWLKSLWSPSCFFSPLFSFSFPLSFSKCSVCNTEEYKIHNINKIKCAIQAANLELSYFQDDSH